MQHRRLDAESFAQAGDELRRQADFGYEHEHLATGLDHVLHALQVDLGLAAAGDAFEQKGIEGVARPQPAQCRLLLAVQGRPR